MNKIEIKKGINLYLVPDSKFKTYHTGIYLHTPLTKENATKNALLPFLLKRGSKNFPEKKIISQKLELLMGASLNSFVTKHGENQIIAFTLSSVSENFSPFDNCFKDGISLLFDIAFNPLLPFSESYLESEKHHLLQLIESEKNDKRSYASLRCRQEMSIGQNYAVPENGYAEEVNLISAKIEEERYRELFSSSPIDIVISGNFDMELSQKIIKELLSSLDERSDVLPSTTPSENLGLKTVTEEMNISQGKLCIGFTCPSYDALSKEYPSMLMYNSIFGGGAHSKLFMNVREKLSLAYYAGSSYVRSKGIIVVSSGIECENFEKAKEEILLQQKAMTDGVISEQEFDSARKSLVNSYLSSMDSLSSLSSFSLGQIISGAFLSPEQMVQAINSVTISDIVAVGKKVEGSLIYFLKGVEK